MPYVIPNLPSVGNFPSVTDYNTAMNDIIWQATGRLLASFSASPAFATTSTTFVVVSTSTCRLSVTTTRANAKVLVTCYVSAHNTVAAASLQLFDMIIDGATYASGGAAGGTGMTSGGASTAFGSGATTFSFIVNIATAGAHTLDLVTRGTSAGTYTLDTTFASALEVA